MTKILLIPITPILDLCDSSFELRYLFKRIDVRELVKISLTTTDQEEINPAMWTYVEYVLTDDEMNKVDSMELNVIALDILLNNIDEKVYQIMKEYLGEDVVVTKIHYWSDDAICLDVRDIFSRENFNSDNGPVPYSPAPY